MGKGGIKASNRESTESIKYVSTNHTIIPFQNILQQTLRILVGQQNVVCPK